MTLKIYLFNMEGLDTSLSKGICQISSFVDYTQKQSVAQNAFFLNFEMKGDMKAVMSYGNCIKDDWVLANGSFIIDYSKDEKSPKETKRMERTSYNRLYQHIPIKEGEYSLLVEITLEDKIPDECLLEVDNFFFHGGIKENSLKGKNIFILSEDLKKLKGKISKNDEESFEFELEEKTEIKSGLPIFSEESQKVIGITTGSKNYYFNINFILDDSKGMFINGIIKKHLEVSNSKIT